MSTPATIQFNGMTYFQSSDGYPNDVIPEMERFVEEAKGLSDRNPDFSFPRALTTLLLEADYQCSEMNGFPAQYAYSIDKDGNVKEDKDNSS